MTENKHTDSSTEGIIEQTFGENKYAFWYMADIACPYISKFLKKEFPNSIIIREFNYTDFVVLKENLPIEVQSTVISHPGKGGQGLLHSEFEQKIEKQLKQNIDRYGRCWFFFDSEYLRYLQNSATKNTRINLDWLYRFIKEGKLRVFTVTYDGNIKEVFCKDLEFILNISKTCPLGRENDERVLDRNKFNIMSNVLEWHKFTTEEIDIMYDKFKSTDHQYKSFYKWLGRDNRTDREFELMYIWGAGTHLDAINNMLDCRVDEDNIVKTLSRDAQKLGLIEQRDTGKHGYMRRFTNNSNIAQFFPGYLRNKELWDDLKARYISYDTLCGMVTGKIDINWYKKQKSIDNAWG